MGSFPVLLRLSTKWLCVAALSLLAPIANVLAQSAPEHHAWQDLGAFEPMSRTAIAITGTITLSGNPSFAEVGSTMQISFNGGPPINLVSEGASWREWSLNGGLQTAEVFRLASDPGPLINGNTICSDTARYMVFSEANTFGIGNTLQVAAFDRKKPPFDINSDGLCGTFSYVVE